MISNGDFAIMKIPILKSRRKVSSKPNYVGQIVPKSLLPLYPSFPINEEKVWALSIDLHVMTNRQWIFTQIQWYSISQKCIDLEFSSDNGVTWSKCIIGIPSSRQKINWITHRDKIKTGMIRRVSRSEILDVCPVLNQKTIYQL